MRAIGGLHVVTLAWDFIGGQDHKEGRATRLRHRARRIRQKRQRVRALLPARHQAFPSDKDEGASPRPPRPPPSRSSPFSGATAQRSPLPLTSYCRRPAYGKPKLLELDRDAATTIKIATEPEAEPGQKGETRHNIYFNRGVAGGHKAYARKFGKTRPDRGPPGGGADEVALPRLFRNPESPSSACAAGKDAREYKLRAMLYEFRYLPVGQAFKEAADQGADVAIRYEAQSYKEDNEAMIAKAKIKRLCKPQKSRAGIRHNKFIVLIHKEKPVAGLGRIDEHVRQWYLQAFECWPRSLGPGDRPTLSRLLGAPCRTPDITRAPLVQEPISPSSRPRADVELAADRISPPSIRPRDDKGYPRDPQLVR